MDKKTKLILSLVGLSAVIIPAVLLVVFKPNTPVSQTPSAGSRQIDPKVIEDIIGKTPNKETIFPSPRFASPSAAPLKASPSSIFEGSKSAQ